MSETLQRDYDLGEEIGRGKSGIVRRCVSTATGAAYAVKSVDKSAISDPFDRNLAENEAKVARLVSDHPNVVSLHAAYEDEDSVHLVLDLCSGLDLHDRIMTASEAGSSASEDEAAKPTPILFEREAAALMRPLMEAVAHCHRRGVAHRDIKPENVLFSESVDQPLLADFGSAACFNGGPMEGIVGTPYYVAPEVVSGLLYNEKVDIWSAGVVLYVMLSGGVPPFCGVTATDIFSAVIRGNLRFPPSVFPQGVSSAAKDLLRKMICRDPSRRISAEQVLGHPWMAIGPTEDEETDAVHGC